ncbi:Minichromosome maintenance protein 10 [Fasciola hepatica]|uniref:Protein MCM10 homolog n=1 Tax=Fasciola hepatica TaxID=6192 RepID=A0A4E0R689_FASHE|nr:Minichromosome maintenance protein 10 [Fasciola hepatica]
MPGNSSDGKHKRRPVGFQLTEDEINNFIAHGGDDEDSDESDWDDLGETNLSEVQYQKKAVQINTNPPKATSSSSTKSKVSERQDAGVDMLFDSSSGPNCVSEATKDDDHFLFGSDESDSETQGLDREEAGDDDDAIPLNEYGSQIQRCLNSAERRARGKLIDKEVEKAIEDSSSTSSSNAKSSTVSSISSALAACAARRKKAIAQLNNAHCPNNNAERTVKPSTALIANTSVPSATHTASTNSPDCWFALPTKLRVHRSRISSELWKQRTTDRQVMTLMQFMQNHRSNPVSNVLTKKSSRSTPSQVLVGVIGSKLPPRRSRNDRIYSVWCLSDLDHIGPGAPHGCVKLFLFGNSHEKLWKESEGTVIAVLGPRTMSDPMAGSSEKDVSITLESPMHVMILGHSPDFGVCAATSKSGQQCFHVINKSVCRYCDVHVKKAYFEASTSRPGFATTQHPVFGKRPIRRNADTLSPMSYTSNFIRPVPETSTTTSFEFRTSFTSRVKLNAAKLSAAGYQFDPSIGLGSQSNSESTATLETSNASASITPTTNLSKRSSTVLSSPERKLIRALRRPSAGSLNLLRQLGLEQASGDGDTAAAQKVSHSSHKKSPQISPTKKSIPTFANFFSSLPKTKKTTSAPSLSTSARFIDLGPIPSQNSVQHPSLAAARLRAAAVVQSQGGVQAMERQVKRRCLSEVVHTPSPNRPSPLSQILGRGKENTHDTLSTSPKTPVESKPPSDGIENISPTLLAKQKRIKQLEDLVRQGSAHTDLIIEAETQAEQSRLFSLEQRDEYHQKLTEQQEEPCTYVHCKTCGYRAWKAAPECSRCDHQLVYVKGTKRYFRCRNCAQRTITFERYPNHCCKNCGESLFEKTGILAERKQSILPGGKLLTRGYEEKHL